MIGDAPISVRIISWDINTSLIMQEIIETKDLFKFLQTKVKEIQAHQMTDTVEFEEVC